MAHKHSAPMYSFAGAHHRGNKTYINKFSSRRITTK